MMNRQKKLTSIIIVLVMSVLIWLSATIFIIWHNIAVNNRNKITATITNNLDTVIQSHPAKHELFSAFYDQAEKLLQTMSLEEKVGQMFLVRLPDSNAIDEIENYHPGGYILFSKDFRDETKTSLNEKIESYQAASKIKLFFGVDEEGGSVVRASLYQAFRANRFPSPQELWSTGELTAILEDSTEKSILLKDIGLNMNLAPVADLPTDHTSFIYQRSLGQNAATTAKYVAEIVKTMNNDNIISVLKHFPGYGDNVDTHTGIAIDQRPYKIFQDSDFLPFISGINAKAPCVLVSHNIVTSMDGNYPASLSSNIHQILRRELHFSGLIMTDDLAMGAITKYAGSQPVAVIAVKAGNDLIISSDFEQQRQEILDAIHTGEISEQQIDQAVKRILACKYAYGII